MFENGSTQIETRGCAGIADVDVPALDFAPTVALRWRAIIDIEGSREVLERCAAGVLVPRVEIDRVDRAHVHRQASRIEPHGHEDVAVGGFARLATHPAGADRGCRPDHDHRCGRQQFGFDLVVELLPGVDFRVPPDCPALRLRSRPRAALRELYRCEHTK